MLINDLEIDPELKRLVLRSGMETLEGLAHLSPIQLLKLPGIGFAEVGKISCMLARKGLVLRPETAVEGAAASQEQADGQSPQMRIDHPEFLHDMEVLGREITRCFGRASGKFNFRASVIAELEDLHAHLVTMNQGPEAILVDAAVQFLRSDSDQDPKTDAVSPPALLPQAEVPEAPLHRKPAQGVESDTGPQYADLPQAFFKAK